MFCVFTLVYFFSNLWFFLVFIFLSSFLKLKDFYFFEQMDLQCYIFAAHNNYKTDVLQNLFLFSLFNFYYLWLRDHLQRKFIKILHCFKHYTLRYGDGESSVVFGPIHILVSTYFVFLHRRWSPPVQTHSPQLRLSHRGAGKWLPVYQTRVGGRQWLLPVSSQQRCWSRCQQVHVSQC